MPGSGPGSLARFGVSFGEQEGDVETRGYVIIPCVTLLFVEPAVSETVTIEASRDATLIKEPDETGCVAGKENRQR